MDMVRIELTVTESAEFYHLSVNDKGKGIKKEHLSSIFDPLKILGVTDRFNQKGTGLGLS
jgi:signal transduction histidine kinase